MRMDVIDGYDLWRCVSPSRFPGSSDGKRVSLQCGRHELNPLEEGRSPGGRHGNPLQYSGLENPIVSAAC